MGKLKPKHHSAFRGQRVFIEFNDGSSIVTKYRRGSDSNREVITDAGAFRWKKIRKFRIARADQQSPVV